jgi:hypothetical protein
MEYINSIGDLLTLISKTSPHEAEHKEVWLRGEPSVNNQPQPGLFREPWFKYDQFTNEEKIERLKRERQFIQDFKVRSANLVHEQISDGNLYFLMRHYKAATRLLDWTTDPLTALYFACQKEEIREIEAKNNKEDGNQESEKTSQNQNKEDEGLVWIMNPFNFRKDQGEFKLKLPKSNFSFEGVATVGNPIYQHHLKSLFEWKDLKTRDYIFPIRPSYFDHRIKVQNSAFTFHANDSENGILGVERNRTLTKCIVNKVALGKELALLKIDQFTIYDDLESLSSAMTANYSKRYSSQNR